MAAWPAQWPRALAAAIDSISCRRTTQPHGHLTRRSSDNDDSRPEARSLAGKRLCAGRLGALRLRWPASPADAGCTCTWLGPGRRSIDLPQRAVCRGQRVSSCQGPQASCVPVRGHGTRRHHGRNDGRQPSGASAESSRRGRAAIIQTGFPLAWTRFPAPGGNGTTATGHSIALPMSSTTFLASPKTIMVLSM